MDWIGKAAVVNHHREVPLRLLDCNKAHTVGEPGSENLLVEGDNLVALRALLPHYAGRVKCVYIDPPYNTGNEGWVYNDNVNSPQMRAWLGKTVGGEAEDLCRHDKWLCMMYPRLRLLREFLRADGAIFISIDDSEVQNLLSVADEVFGRTNRQSIFLWQHSLQPKGYSGIVSVHHNYVACYSRGPEFRFGDLPRSDQHNVNYSNPDNDPNGLWRSGDVRNALYRPNLIYDLVTPSGNVIKPPEKGWRWQRSTMEEKIASGEIVFRDNETRIVRKIYLANQEGRAPESIWFGEDVGTTREANAEIKDLFGGRSAFDTPKPTRLIKRILQIATGPDDLVLDSFAGSGTTAQAVLELNREDGGNRRFILVEMEPEISRNVTAKRLEKVINGYSRKRGAGSEDVLGTGGGFRYCTLGPELFDRAGTIHPEVTFSKLARYAYFDATGEPLPGRQNGPSPLLGVHDGRAVYLLFNGILGDKRPAGGNVLTRDVLAGLPPHDGPKVVYGEGTTLSDPRLADVGVSFKQIPYELTLGGR